MEWVVVDVEGDGRPELEVWIFPLARPVSFPGGPLVHQLRIWPGVWRLQFPAHYVLVGVPLTPHEQFSISNADCTITHAIWDYVLIPFF